MSICGNCHYQMEFGECDYECTFEDAVYKEQAAYDSLLERYEVLEKNYNTLERRLEECTSQLLRLNMEK